LGYFQNIKLENYRNFNNFEIDFCPECNVFIGKNGSGKTNLLESISLFEKGRGFRKDNIKNFINNKNNKQKFIVSSIFISKNARINLSLFNQVNEGNLSKKILVNGNSSKDSLQYFESLFSLIFFLPEMERLFLSNPSVRRNFLDRLIFNIDKNYNYLINQYKKNIIERSKILKNYKYDIEWVNSLEKKIADLGIQIYKKRLNHVNIINSNLKKLDSYNKYSYKISISIEDYLIENTDKNINQIYEYYINQLKKARKLDAILGGCKIGPHRSDIIGLNIENNSNINQFSTGQQKTIILLIILAQCKFLISEVKIKPIIFFDEVCSHLDIENRELLLDLIESLKVQTFITGTERNFFSFLSTKGPYCNITSI